MLYKGLSRKPIHIHMFNDNRIQMRKFIPYHEVDPIVKPPHE